MLTSLAAALTLAQVPAPCTPAWTPFGAVPDGAVQAAVEFDDGSGRALFVGGAFTAVGGIPAARVARWDGHAWSAVGDGFDARVFELCVHDDGNGPALYAGGEFRHSGGRAVSSLARWDGTDWQEVGGGLVDGVQALASFDDGSGPSLYVGGNIPVQTPPHVLGRMLRWDGSAFHDVPGTLGETFGGRGTVNTMQVHDDGSGEKLWVGGAFDTIGTLGVSHLATWDGQSWAVPGGFDGGGSVNDLEVFDGPSGPRLIAGGVFHLVGGTAMHNVTAWDGQSWSPLGLGLRDPFFAVAYGLETFDDGQGDALYVSGSFSLAGNAAARRIARWDGAAWSDVGGAQPTNTVLTLEAYDDPVLGPMLLAGGFGQIPAAGEPFAWRWGGCGVGPVGVSECTSTTNSTGRPGRIEATGAVRRARNDVVLHAFDLPTNAFILFLTSRDAGFVPNPAGSMGNLCLAGAIGRYVDVGQIQNSASTGTAELRVDLGAMPGPNGPSSALAGETWHFQAWHRAQVTGAPTSNLTDAVAITFE